MRLERAREREQQEEKDEGIFAVPHGRERRKKNSTFSTTPTLSLYLSATTTNKKLNQVPFAMISLLQAYRQAQVPYPNLKCRMLVPSSGSRYGLGSGSVWRDWRGAFLQAYELEQNTNAPTARTRSMKMQEDFALGIGETLARARAGEKVAAGAARAAAATTGAAKELDAEYKVTAGARAAAGAVKGIGAKALEDERVAAAASAVGGRGLRPGWRWARGRRRRRRGGCTRSRLSAAVVEVEVGASTEARAAATTTLRRRPMATWPGSMPPPGGER